MAAKTNSGKERFTRKQHIAVHELLHGGLDELVADYIFHNAGEILSETSIADLMRWSHEQTIRPTDPPATGRPR